MKYISYNQTKRLSARCYHGTFNEINSSSRISMRINVSVLDYRATVLLSKHSRDTFMSCANRSAHRAVTVLLGLCPSTPACQRASLLSEASSTTPTYTVKQAALVLRETGGWCCKSLHKASNQWHTQTLFPPEPYGSYTLQP